MKIAITLLLGTLIIAACTSPSKKIEEKKIPKSTPAKENKIQAYWSYEGLFGPELWGSLDPKFNLCKEGKNQSPIDLVWKKPIKNGEIDFQYKNQPLQVIDTGNSINVNIQPGSTVNIRGDVYSLLNIRFHTPSEHTLSGKSHPMEAHFIHKNTAGKTAIVAVFFKQGMKNTELEKILGNIPVMQNKIKLANCYLNR